MLRREAEREISCSHEKRFEGSRLEKGQKKTKERTQEEPGKVRGWGEQKDKKKVNEVYEYTQCAID